MDEPRREYANFSNAQAESSNQQVESSDDEEDPVLRKLNSLLADAKSTAEVEAVSTLLERRKTKLAELDRREVFQRESSKS